MTHATEAEQRRFETFAHDLTRAGRKTRTVQSYRSDWLGLGRWLHARYGEALDLDTLSRARMAEYRAHLLAERKRASTINRKLTFVRRYADWARGQGLDGERADALQSVPAVDQPRRTPRGLSDIERARLVRAVEEKGSTRDAAIIQTLLQTGVRVSELVGLHAEDVHLDRRTPSLFIAADGQSRHVDLGPAARRALRRYLKERGTHSGPLFVGERGPLTANGVQRILRRHGNKAKVKATPSTLRHTFASRYLRANRGDLVELADVLGHECLDTTRLYVQAVREQAVEAQPRLVEAPRTSERPLASN